MGKGKNVDKMQVNPYIKESPRNIKKKKNNNNNNNNNGSSREAMELDPSNVETTSEHDNNKETDESDEGQGNNSDSKENENQDSEQDQSVETIGKQWVKIEKRMQYKASIAAENLSTKDINRKCRILENKLSELGKDFLGIKFITINRKQYIVASFSSEIARNKACNLTLEENNEHKLEPDINTTFNPQKMIRLTCIPLNITRKVIEKSVEQELGEISKIKTRTSGPWRIADVELKEELDESIILNQWAIRIQKDDIKMLPYTLTKEQIQTREKFTMKLTNLPFGTTAYDLEDISKATNAKMLIIPRTNTRYVRKRFAIFYYNSEEDRNQAITTSFTVGNNNLEWAGANEHTCHLCGSMNHLIVNCNIKLKKDVAREKDQKFTDVYRKYGIQKHALKGQSNRPKKTYAETVKSQNKTLRSNTTTNNTTSNKLPLPQPEVIDLVSFKNFIIQELNTIKQDMKKLQQQIDAICGEEYEENTDDNSEKIPMITPPSTDIKINVDNTINCNNNGIEAIDYEKPPKDIINQPRIILTNNKKNTSSYKRPHPNTSSEDIPITKKQMVDNIQEKQNNIQEKLDLIMNQISNFVNSEKTNNNMATTSKSLDNEY
jgi:hypothetical protein